ncbi:MAG: N-acetylmuramoyl-L-alanine amidase [Anaeromyxobacter sp.]
MGRAKSAVLLLLLALAPQPAVAASRQARSSAHAAAPARPPPARSRSALSQAKTAYAALLRDKTKRRYRHNWERAIAAFERAARGSDTGPALLEAARARYALYRWSADEADRDQALRLANRAAKHGAQEGRALAAAIRREAGDDRPAPPPPARRPPPSRSAVAHAPAPSPPPAAAPEPEPDAAEEDPALLAALQAPDVEVEPLAMGLSSGEGSATVTEVRAWSSPGYTRVAIYLSHWVGWQKHELAAGGDRPRRLALDLRPAVLVGRTLQRDVGGDQVARVRAAQNDRDTVRVVLDLAGRDKVTAFQLDDPPRLVLDVGAPVPREPPALAAAPAAPGAAAPADGSGAAVAGVTAASGPVPAAEVPAPTPALTAGGTDTVVTLPPRVLAALADVPGPAPAAAAQPEPAALEVSPPALEGERTIRRVVVDAGHGGHDPGAIGPSRVREKDVTLAIARRLARKLRAAGFEVVLTRDGDRYLALEERTALANTARGDLFVSIHANAHPRRTMSGVETYFLNVTDDRYARRLAARENGVDMGAQGEVARILTDLDAKASADASQQLARQVQREVCSGVRAGVGDVKDLGVKNALFYVLLGARMPAVLVETGFISNKVEEKRLASAEYQERVASGVTRAVVSFARSAPRIATN